MKITKDMVHEELKPYFSSLKVLPYLLSRKWGIRLFNILTNSSKGKNIKGLDNEERYIPSRSGAPDIRIRIFKPLNAKGKLPVLFYIHGGGYLVGMPEASLPPVKGFIKTRPCVVIAPAYRRSLDAPYPAAFNDCYDTMVWAKENAEELGIYSDKFMVAGHSAGGGLTAAVTLKARDTKEVDIAFQMPIYPMIDDVQNTRSAIEMSDVPVWNTNSNAAAWDFYLKGLKDRNENIPPYAAAARNDDYSDFPPTITFVGDLEPFKDETIAYVEALKSANIPVEFKLYKGAFHAFDSVAPKTSISKDAISFTQESFAAYYDKYVL